MADKHLVIMKVFSEWMKIVQKGRSIKRYLKENSIDNVAIYGMGMLGERLFDELYDSGINVVCGIDRDLKKHYKNVELKSIESIPDEVACIIVTAIFYYEDIRVELSEKTKASIISLQSIIEELGKIE